MQGVPPINCNKILDLASLGVSHESISFSSVTMESDKYICIREKTGEGAQIVIVDLNNPQSVIRKSISATSGIMNPVKQILGLKAGKTLQLFNLEQKSRIKVHELTSESGLWKWLSPDIVGIVTQTSVLSWSINDEGAPEKLFDRHERMSSVQIINLKADPELKWMILSGISGQQGSRVAGTLQLFSVAKNVSQILEGHAATFFTYKLAKAAKPSLFFSFASRGPQGGKFYIIELSTELRQDLFKKQSELAFAEAYADDFPITMQADEKLGLVYFLTKHGFLFIQDVESALTIFHNRISQNPMFITCPQTATNGFLGISRNGSVMSVSVNEGGIVQHVRNTISNPELVLSLASRVSTHGVADDLYVNKFNHLFAEGKYLEAVELAAKAPGQILRNPQTIQRFQSIQVPQGQPPPLLKYFTLLLETDKLNRHESLELCRLVLQQNRKNLVEKWLKEDKLECSEELGDFVRSFDTTLALSVFLRANVPSKVVELFAETGQYQNIVPYARKVGYNVDYLLIIRNLMRTNPDKATQVALSLVQGEEQQVDLDSLVQVFLEAQQLPALTRFLLEALKHNRPEEAHLQNKLLELNLSYAPNVADAILGNRIFTHYDKQNVGRMCERAGLFQRALENYSDIYDIKRALMHTNAYSPEFLVEYFANLGVKEAMECLLTMLQTNLRQNIQIVVEIASKYHELLGVSNIISMFEGFKSAEGIFLFVRQIINVNHDPEVHLTYIKSAYRVGQLTEVERICRESDCYDPEKVKNFLKESRLVDLLPLVIVCERFDFIDDLISYLYKNSQYKYIEILVQKINPARLPLVVGCLIRLDCVENVIKQLIMSTPAGYSAEELLTEVERHNRPKLVVQMLERALQNGSTDTEVHSALAKIYIDNNMNPDRFLKDNEYYDKMKIGRYCESRNPQLACVAYDKGNLPHELIRVTNDNSLFKIQARYLMRQRNEEIWSVVLSEDNNYRRPLIDQIVQTALPESQNADEISTVVKCFLDAKLTDELIELLEKIVLENSIFSEHSNLQNLLILTALNSTNANPSLYLDRLDRYNAPEMAKKMRECNRYEDVFFIYKKFGDNVMALRVLVDDIGDLDRAFNFVDHIGDPVMWAILGRAQLGRSDLIREAMTSLIRSGDVSDYAHVVSIVDSVDDHWDELVTYLMLVRKTVRNTDTDNSLVLAYAKCDRINELCEFVESSQNHADFNRVGDQCFNSGLFQASKVLFAASNNHLKLSVTLVHLGEYHSAIEAARKANNSMAWLGVLAGCIEHGELRLAKIAALHLVTDSEHLPVVIGRYEDRGYFSQLIEVMEASLVSERCHMGIYTELAILYTKYMPSKTLEHLELFWSNMNIPKVLQAVDAAHMWLEKIYLYEKYEEFDNVICTFMEHPSLSYRDTLLRDVAVKVASSELIYRLIVFIITYRPMKLDELMTAVSSRVDQTRAIQIVKKHGVVHLLKNYLMTQHCRGSKAVDEAVNDLLIEEGHHEELLSIVETKSNASYDKLELAKKLQKHELRAFRYISSYLMRQSNKFSDAVDLCKQDELYQQAIIHASESNDPQLVYSLIEWFLDKNLPGLFSATLYHCYSLFTPDRVLEYAWRFNAMDFAMPFFIQTLHSLNNRVKKLEERDTARTVKEESNDNEYVPMTMNNSNLMIGGPGMFTGGGAPPF